MNLIKTAVLAGAATMAFASAAPAEATWSSDTSGYWGGSSGWGSSGWGSSGWGSSGWGSSGWGSSGWGSSGWGSSGWGSSGYGSSSYGGTTSSSTGGTTSTSTSTGGSTGSSGGGTPVPEPSNLLMLGLGMAGLVAGRLVARRRKSKKP